MPVPTRIYIGSTPVLRAYVGSALVWEAPSDDGGGGGGTVDGFTDLGPHPQAAAQPTDDGKVLRRLTTHGGKVWAAYGDIAENTGPIAANPFDPATDTFTGAMAIANSPEPFGIFTEAVYNFRKGIDGKLYASHVDPRGANGGYAVLSGGAWSDHYPVIDPLHIGDMAVLANGHIYLAGYDGGSGRIWRSTDGGSTVESILVVSGAAFWWVCELGGKIVTQAFGPSPFPFASRTYDPGADSWTLGPTIDWYSDLPERVLGNRLIADHYTVGLVVYDGTTATTVPGFTDEAVLSISAGESDAWCFVLLNDGTVKRSPDLATWTTVATGAPGTATSITVCGGYLYVGTSDSKLYRSTGPLPA